jgi:hypothetical protein
MTIEKMDLLCTIDSQESGSGGTGSKCGPRGNARGVFVSLMIMWLSLCSTLHGQTSQGSIAGTVKDAKEALVQNAAVEVFNTATGVRQSTRTNSAGAFSVVSLNPGSYNVIVSKSGFEKSVTNAVTVSTAQLSTVDVTLTVGSQTATVTVTAQDSLLSKDDSNVTTTVDHAVVESLPYPERSSLEATLLVPGVNGDPLQPGGISTENPNAFTSYVLPGASIAIGGAPPGTSSILVDGSDVTQGSYARAGVNLSGKLVQETTVVVTGLSAKYGRTGGGVIVQSSASGTNGYHGAITYRHTDPFFNAYPDGSTAASALHQNYYGFYVGGPVRIPKIYDGRDKTFFFVGVEPARMKNSSGARGTFQTPAELTGYMHNSLALLNSSILKTQGYAAALAAPRIGTINYQTTVNANGFPNGLPTAPNIKQIMGPATDCPASDQVVGACPDDVGPQLRQNPFAQYVLSLFPTPTNPGPYVTFDNSAGTSQNDGTNGTYKRGVLNIDNRYSFRIDHQFSNADQIYVRYTVIPVIGNRFFEVSASNPMTIVPTDAARTHDIAIGYTHVFSNAVVNNFRYSFMRVNQQRLSPGSAQTDDFAGKYGLTPAVFGKGFPSLGNLNANGYGYTTQMGLATASIQADQNFVVGNDVTWTHGSHLFQFGVDVRWIQSNQYDLSGATGGKYSFSAGTTNNGSSGGAPLASFILGTINSFSNSPVLTNGYYRWHYYAGYLQDDWRVTPKITLNLGFRYNVETPRTEKFDNQAFAQLSPGSLNGVATPVAFCFSGACGTQRNMWPINYHGYEPRFGISYAPTSRTTVRASYVLTHLPLTGYANTPDPDFNVAGQTVNSLSGGISNTSVTNYITNPIGPLTSGLAAFGGSRGPILSSTGIAPEFVSQSNAVPYTQTWSATVQYQLTSKTLVQGTYQGLKGTHLIGAFTGAFNIPSVSTIASAINGNQYLGLQTTPNPYGISQNGAVIKETNLQLLNPIQNFFNFPLTEIYPREGASSYNALYISLNQRFGHGLSLLANYTWSKSIDDVPNTGTGANSGVFGTASQQNPLTTLGEKAISSFDQPSRLKAGYTYQLPFGRGQTFDTHNSFLNQIIGNISTSGILTVESGFPNSVVLGSTGYFTSMTPTGTQGCTASGTTSGARNMYCASTALPSSYGYTLRPNIVPGVPLINKNWKATALSSNFVPYINPAAFTTPGTQGNPMLGNAPRTLSDGRSPRETMFDASVRKGFTIRERYKVSLVGTFINAFNHPVYFGLGTRTLQSTSVTANLATGTLTPVANGSFGQFNVGNTSGFSRVIQVGGEFTF